MPALAPISNGARLPSTPTRATLKRSVSMPTSDTPNKKRKTPIEDFDSEANKENIAPGYLGLITPTKGSRRPSNRKPKTSKTSPRSSSIPSVLPSTSTPSPSPSPPRRSSFILAASAEFADDLSAGKAFDFEFEFLVGSDTDESASDSGSTPPSSP